MATAGIMLLWFSIRTIWHQGRFCAIIGGNDRDGHDSRGVSKAERTSAMISSSAVFTTPDELIPEENTLTEVAQRTGSEEQRPFLFLMSALAAGCLLFVGLHYCQFFLQLCKQHLISPIILTALTSSVIQATHFISVPSELLCFISMSAVASLGLLGSSTLASIPLAFDVFLPASLALSLLLRAAAASKPTPGETTTSFAIGNFVVTGGAFAFGVAGTMLGCILATGLMSTFGRGVLSPYLLVVSIACLAASYIGGTVNFFETARILAPSRDAMQYLMLIAGADIVVMGLYFFALHAIRQTQGADPATRVGPELEVNYERSLHDVLQDGSFLLFALALGLSFAKLSGFLATAVHITSFPLIGMISAAYASGSIFRRLIQFKWKKSFFRSLHYGSEFFMSMFFATLGSTATLSEMQRVGPTALGLMSLVLALHLGTMFLGRWLWNRVMADHMDTDTILVASNACAGGPATAASMAESIKRPDLTLPATTVGILGYVIGTHCGVFLYRVLSTALHVAM